MSENQLPTVIPRARDGRWLPGTSANPGGKPVTTDEFRRCRDLCRGFSEEAIIEIRRLSKESDDDRVRLLASQWLHEQAWGKSPVPYDPLNDPEIQGQPLDLADPEVRRLAHALIEAARRAAAARRGGAGG
jgi:hypothetical protein